MIETTLMITLVCFVGHTLAVIGLLHMRTHLAPLLLHAISALAWHCCQLAMLFALDATRYYWHAAALFALGVVLLVFGFSAVYKSVALRALVFIAKNPETTASVQDIHQHVVMR